VLIVMMKNNTYCLNAKREKNMKLHVRKCQVRAAGMAAATRGRSRVFKGAEVRLEARLAELEEEITKYHRRH
jgi:hypothetical protein